MSAAAMSGGEARDSCMLLLGLLLELAAAAAALSAGT
jgi:hypothetical protein